MNTPGGFLLDTHWDAETSRAGADRNQAKADDDGRSALEVRRLTPKQEMRLMNYLEEAFQQLNRGFSKRYTSASTSSVPTLESYLTRIESMLDIIASIPPVGPSAQLLINYLLRYTTEITDGLQGYELGNRADRRTSDDVSKALKHTVRALDLLDRVWAAVLRGKMINLTAAKQHTVQDTERSREELSHPGMLRRDEETTGRYASAANDDLVEENRSVVGSRGYATVAQTQRIRLRNVLTLAKETLFTWMRTQLDAPPPPQIDGSEREARSERRELVAQEGDLDDVKNGNVQPDPEGMQAVTTDVEGEDVVLEDVDLDLRRPAENRISDPLEDEGEEQKHYTSLFEKTLDPDAIDSDEDVEHDRSVNGTGRKRAHSGEIDDSRTARKLEAWEGNRREEAHERIQDTSVEPTEAESEATFMGTSGPNAAAVMRWDVAFARIFSRTLRCLSDIQDYYERRGVDEQVDGKQTVASTREEE